MSRRQKILWGIAGGAVILLVALGVVWWGWLPSAIRDRASAAGERLGVRVVIDDVSPRLAGFVLEGVQVRGRQGDGLAVDIDEVGVQGGLLAMAFGGAEGIEEVQARGVRARLDATVPGFAESV